MAGWKPFRQSWRDLTDEDIRGKAARLLAAAEAEGYDIVWKNDAGEFVGVMGMGLEARSAFHAGNDFPVRISFLSKARGARWEAELKLGVRTVVLWDTGERVRLADLGTALVSKAAAR